MTAIFSSPVPTKNRNGGDTTFIKPRKDSFTGTTVTNWSQDVLMSTAVRSPFNSHQTSGASGCSKKLNFLAPFKEDNNNLSKDRFANPLPLPIGKFPIVKEAQLHEESTLKNHFVGVEIPVLPSHIHHHHLEETELTEIDEGTLSSHESGRV